MTRNFLYAFEKGWHVVRNGDGAGKNVEKIPRWRFTKQVLRAKNLWREIFYTLLKKDDMWCETAMAREKMSKKYRGDASKKAWRGDVTLRKKYEACPALKIDPLVYITLKYLLLTLSYTVPSVNNLLMPILSFFSDYFAHPTNCSAPRAGFLCSPLVLGKFSISYLYPEV